MQPHKRASPTTPDGGGEAHFGVSVLQRYCFFMNIEQALRTLTKRLQGWAVGCVFRLYHVA